MTLKFLGTGTSTGVPMLTCRCAVCTSSDPHDKRTRPSILLEYDGRVVVIDTTPDFRTQALREGLARLDAVVFTHGHADHIMGLDDTRVVLFPPAGADPHLCRSPLHGDDSRQLSRTSSRETTRTAGWSSSIRTLSKDLLICGG